MASEWERLYQEARHLHQAGRLDDALRLYQHVIAGNPGHGGAMHMLGLLAYQKGRPDTAVDLLSQAAVLDPLVGAVHSNLGLALKARGRIKAAEESLRRAVLLAPQAETHANLGQLLLEQGRLEEAATSFRAALARNSGLVAAHTGLGEVLWKLGRAGEAEAAQEKAAAIEPASETLANLALLAFTRGDAATALTRIRQALAAGETARAKAVFAAIAHRMRWQRDDPQIRPLLERALAEGWARPEMLLAPAADLVKLRLAEGGGIESDALLQAMLASAPNSDAELEAMLTALRRQLLARPENRDLHFTAALAQQCFLNGYVFAEEDGERAEAEALAARIEQALDGDDVVGATALLAVACYRPLATLGGAERLLLRAWPDPLEPVLRQQLSETAEEKRLAAELPALTPCDDKAAPDAEPHPRWVRMESGEAPSLLVEYLGLRFPAFDAAALPLLPHMLFAGCGTGRAALELARRHPASGRLGVDPSRADLAHAARKAAQAGIEIAFAQADILALPQGARRFSLIACETLHRLADPLEGWRALLACLLPGGVMRLSLFSAAARRPLAAGRDWIAAQGFTPAAEDIRAARARLLAERPQEALPLLDETDFHNRDGCRDLFFPGREHDLELAQIAAFLQQNGLVLLGFEIGEEVLGAYRARFPDDPGTINLDNWAAFEAEHPGLFQPMLRFWVQKP